MFSVRSLYNYVMSENDSSKLNSPSDNILPKKKPFRGKQNGNRYPQTLRMVAATMLESGKSGLQVSKELGMGITAVYSVKDDPELQSLSNTEVSYIKDGINKLVRKRGYQALKAMDEEKLRQSSALQLMTVAAISIDKSRLLDGESTQNINMRSVNANLDLERRKIAEELGEL